jgi:hypothetical protein
MWLSQNEPNLVERWINLKICNCVNRINLYASDKVILLKI